MAIKEHHILSDFISWIILLEVNKLDVMGDYPPTFKVELSQRSDRAVAGELVCSLRTVSFQPLLKCCSGVNC
jgi:hypothetical protein